jgi:hypothetical protein
VSSSALVNPVTLTTPSEAVIRAARRIDCCEGVPSVPYAAAYVSNAQQAGFARRFGEWDKSAPLLPFAFAPVRQEGARSGTRDPASRNG